MLPKVFESFDQTDDRSQRTGNKGQEGEKLGM